MHDLKYIMRDHFLRYASYVILDRAIPNIVDGLKPVQRRVLYTLFRIDDKKFHKVANVCGQAMAYHPHGDAPIYEALVNVANKNYLLDTQGNFGNILTGDPAAASRYIETRLSDLARETLFNKELTAFIASYDGRNEESVTLPAKIPLLLMQGAEGIAVGMATKILPHNFQELLEAEIAVLEGKPFKILPDFPTGGIVDASQYDQGRGKIRLRVKIEVADPKTLVIREICYGTTTESLIRSIDEAAKKGKVKIDSIHDYTASKVEIEIRLPRGQYAEEVIDLLYAFTECEVSISPQMVVIRDGFPVEMTVNEMVHYHVSLLQQYLQKELELEAARLIGLIFDKTLEQIFIENKIYKHIEEVEEYEEVYAVLEKAFKPFLQLLERLPKKEDYDRLLSIPIRRIGRFDREKNEKDIRSLREALKKVRSDLAALVPYTIAFIRGLLDKYGKLFPRKTKIKRIEELDKRAIETKEIEVGFDSKTGYLGTKVKGDVCIGCTNFDKLLLMMKNGEYKIINIPEKQYIGVLKKEVAHVGIADKQTIFSCAYEDKESGLWYAKRFVVKQFIMDKVYRFVDEGMNVKYLTTKQEPTVLCHLVSKPKQKVSVQQFAFAKVLIKSVQSKGVRMASRHVMQIVENNS